METIGTIALERSYLQMLNYRPESVGREACKVQCFQALVHPTRLHSHGNTGTRIARIESGCLYIYIYTHKQINIHIYIYIHL